MSLGLEKEAKRPASSVWAPLHSWSEMYPSIHLSTYPSFHLSIFPSNHLSIYPSNHLSIFPSNHLSVYLSIHLSSPISPTSIITSSPGFCTRFPACTWAHVFWAHVFTGWNVLLAFQPLHFTPHTPAWASPFRIPAERVHLPSCFVPLGPCRPHQLLVAMHHHCLFTGPTCRSGEQSWVLWNHEVPLLNPAPRTEYAVSKCGVGLLNWFYHLLWKLLSPELQDSGEIVSWREATSRPIAERCKVEGWFLFLACLAAATIV